MVSAARQAARPISDFDTFWHLHLGQEILRTRSLEAPTTSWSALSDQHWVPTQWLTEIAMATAHELWGLPGVVSFFAASVLVLLVVIHRLCRQGSGPIAAAFVTGLCVVAMAPSLSPRPHMVSYVLLAVTLSAWLRSCRDLKPRWWLIPLTWAWSMSHGMWFTGPVLGLVVTAGLFADRRLTRRRVSTMAAVPALSFLVAGLTPVGPELLTAPFAVAGVSAFITEWQAPSFRSPGPAVAMAMVAFTALAWARRTRPTPWAQLAILLLGTAWILLAARTVALGALLLAPLLAETIQAMLKQPRDLHTRREQVTVISSAVVCLVAVFLLVPPTAKDPAVVPTDLGPALASIPEGSAVLNSYELGGWLRWAHPNVEPVVDGMTEAYSVGYLTDYGRVQTVSPGWSDIIDQYDPGYALVAEQSPLATALLERLQWERIGSSDGYLLLRANDATDSVSATRSSTVG